MKKNNLYILPNRPVTEKKMRKLVSDANKFFKNVLIEVDDNGVTAFCRSEDNEYWMPVSFNCKVGSFFVSNRNPILKGKA